MKKAFGLLAAFVLFLAAVFVVLAIVPPTGLAQRLLVAGTRTATGLDLKIAGPMSLRLLPSVSLRMENVALASPDDAQAKPLVSARTVEVRTSLFSSLLGERRVDHVAISGADIDLEIGTDGNLKGTAPPRTRSPSAIAPRSDYVIASLDVQGATIAVRDATTGLAARLENVAATLRDARVDRFAEAIVKAGSAELRDRGPAGRITISDLDAKATGYHGARAAELTVAGRQARWLDAAGSTTLDATSVTATARNLALSGADTLTLAAAAATWRENAGRSLTARTATGEITAPRLGELGQTRLAAASLEWREPLLGSLEASDVGLLSASVRPAAMGDVEVKAGTMQWTQNGSRLDARSLTGRASSVSADRAESVTLSATRLSYGDTRRTNAPTPVTFDEASFATPVLTAATPLEGTVGFLWNREKVAGRVRLPALASINPAALPATLNLSGSGAELDFEGTLDAAAGSAKGRTQVRSAEVERAVRWLGIPAPAALKGHLEIDGDVDAAGSRIALSKGRIAHGANTLSGNVAVDLAGARPRLTGRLSADRLDVEPYLGLQPVKPRPSAGKPAAAAKPQTVTPEVDLSEVFKTYVRALADAPPKRSPGPMTLPDLSHDDLVPAARRAKPSADSAWSEERLDFSPLRTFDLDMEWQVRRLDVRGFTLDVPRLKTVVDAGTLSLEGRDLGTKDGRISGIARIDARETVPAIETSFTGSGVDVAALSAAIGVTPVIEGDTTVDAILKGRGASQKEIVQSLTGSVKTDMPRGNVLGYDLGAINLSTFIRWITGNREYDPERRTPITGLKADLTIDKGVVRDSQVVIGGPLLGVNAEGTIGLVEQRIDYRGRARIASWFSGLPFKIFGDLSRPTFQPDLSLASVFSRAGPGEATLADIVAGADIKEDAELAFLIGRALQKTGPNGLDPATADLLKAVQAKALGRK